MKTLNFLPIILISVLTLNSCKKEESKPAPTNPVEKPKPIADFSYSGANTLAPVNVVFINKSTNSTSYLWDFGDNETSTQATVVHTFKQGGVYTVKLTATGEGGTSSTTKTVNILTPTQVKITKVVVEQVPFVDSFGSSWDTGDGPDLYFNILDATSTVELSGEGQNVPNVIETDLPVYWTFNIPFLISDLNSVHVIELWDYDSLSSNEQIGYIGFNFNDYITGSNPIRPLSPKRKME